MGRYERCNAFGNLEGKRLEYGSLFSCFTDFQRDLYESASLDGAGTIAKFIYVTIPSIKGTILFALVMLTIGGFNVFTSIKMITDGNPGHKTESVLTWMYYKAFSTGEFGYSAALSFIIAVVLGILAVVQFRMMDHSKLD